MKINSSKLFINESYVYDITSCHYQILDKFGYDLSEVDKIDKLKRNIQIGLMMKDNPNLTNLLRGVTDKTISEIIISNNLKPEEIILKQYDGIIVTRSLKNLNVGLELKLKNTYNPMILDINKTTYIAKDGSETIIKGLAEVYPAITRYISRLVNINYLSKLATFKELDKIKRSILESENIEDFLIPDNKRFGLYMLEYGKIFITKSVQVMIDTNDIDKMVYFTQYLLPFIKSIVLSMLTSVS